ncbi:MAG: hypothetical protein L6R37_002894 [Teloschistes peruensis]|nr:MAG: hypothetical protein L6R37_002894 [Teloschistes peruensis]
MRENCYEPMVFQHLAQIHAAADFTAAALESSLMTLLSTLSGILQDPLDSSTGSKYPCVRITTMYAMQALLLNNAVCRKIFLQDNGKPYDQILVGAIIARKGTGVGKPEILLVKRAADEGNSHSTWEIPRGKVEDSDATLFDAVKREIREKTGI